MAIRGGIKLSELCGMQETRPDPSSASFTKEFPRVVFTIKAVEDILTEYNRIVKDATKTKYYTLKVARDNEHWDYDSIDEFYADFRAGFSRAAIRLENPEITLELTITNRGEWSLGSEISIRSGSRESVVKLIHVLDSFEKECYTPPKKSLNQK